MPKYLLFCIVFFLSIKSHATHLVGGEMNYRFIRESNDTVTYEILLTVYRDCYGGVPDFDYPAYILVYEGNGRFLGGYTNLGNPKTQLPVEIDDECFVAPADVCVEKKEYRFLGGLPVNTSGYYLSYQRCCRNTTILNIFDDNSDNVADSGMNLFAFIPPRARVVNSNPVFNGFPPVAICVGKPLIFDHSARDYDGDSLVYKLCIPTDALHPDRPTVGYGVDSMPFADVRWRNPYSLADILGGPEKLKIDSKTGLLTALPDKIGQFAVGVCVEEYRNGVYISETKRDFQFNVSTCGKFSVSSFFTYDTICNSLEVSFLNESIEADSFLWQFGDGVQSVEKNPVHRFPAYGTYNVTLIASGENGCSDTLTRRIVLKEDNFSFEIEDVTVCKGQEALLKVNPSTRTVREIQWLQTPSVYTTEPEYSYIPSKSEEINFEIYNTSGCIYPGKVNVTVKELPPVNIQFVPQHIFTPQSVRFSSTASTSYEYLWESTGQNSSPQSSGTDIYIDKDQWIYLTITDRQTGCMKRDSVFIKIETCDLIDEFDILSYYEHSCSEALLYLDILDTASDLKYTWVTEEGIVSGPSVVLDLKGDKPYNYSLIVEKEGYCTDTINYQEGMFESPISIGRINYKVCEGVTTLNVDLDIRSEGNFMLTWGDFSDTLRNQDRFQLQLTGSDLEIPLVVVHEDDCVLQDTLRIDIIDVSVEAVAVPNKVKEGEVVSLSVMPSGFESYNWYPQDLVANPAGAQTSYIVQETTDFIVVVKDENGCEGTDTVTVEVIEDLCDFSSEYQINRSLETNCDGGVLSLKIQSDNPELKFSWEVNNVVTTGADLTLNIEANQSYVYYLIVAHEDICIDTIRYEEKIISPLISIETTDYKVCEGITSLEVELNIQSTVDYAVLWGNLNDTLKNEDKFQVSLTGSNLEIPVIVIYNDSCRLNEKVLVDIVSISVNASATPEVVEKGQNTTLSAQPGNLFSYQWYPEQIPADPRNAQTLATMYGTTDFIVVAKDENGCEATDTVRVEVIDNDPCNFREDFTIVRNLVPNCEGATLSLNINTANQELKFKWIVDNAEIAGKELILKLTNGMSATYQLVIEDNIPCIDTIDYEDNVNDSLISMKVSDYRVCPDVTRLDVDLNIQSSVDYKLSWGNYSDTVVNSSTFSIQLEETNLAVPVMVMYNDSCTIKDTISIEIAQPKVEANAEPVVVQKGKETALSASPDDFISYQWYPQQIPASSQSAQTVAVIYESTDFIVIAKDENGCEASDTVRVEVIDDRCNEENIFVPTAFTPNGDGVNDIWMVRADVKVDISVAIYNRWGEKVFESNDIQRGWDGVYNGSVSENGSYAYYLTIICENQLQYFSKGSISLIR